jgi:hypothetical protein
VAEKKKVKITLPGRLPDGPLVFTKKQWAKIKREQDGPPPPAPPPPPPKARPRASGSPAEARSYLEEERGQVLAAAIVERAEVWAADLGFADPGKAYQPPNLTPREARRLVDGLKKLRPLVVRAAPPSYVRRIDELITYCGPKRGGRPRDDVSIFAKKMLASAWTAEELGGAMLTASELMAVAIVVGVERPDRREIRQRWDKLHKRNTPRK